MWQLIMGIYISVGAMFDLVKQKIPSVYLIVGTAMAVIETIWKCEQVLGIKICGAGIGILFLLIAKFTNEQIGYGDGWMILIQGIYLGIWELLQLLCIGFGICFLVSCVGMMCKKMNRRTRLPFYPFLLAGYVGVILW